VCRVGLEVCFWVGGLAVLTYRPVVDAFPVQPCAAEAPGEESEGFESSDAEGAEMGGHGEGGLCAVVEVN
jgi:hypothetical protein